MVSSFFFFFFSLLFLLSFLHKLRICILECFHEIVMSVRESNAFAFLVCVMSDRFVDCMFELSFGAILTQLFPSSGTFIKLNNVKLQHCEF